MVVAVVKATVVPLSVMVLFPTAVALVNLAT
jgi:hypothetical protein